jgi:hypothetical protein
MGTSLHKRRNNLHGLTLRAVVTEVCHAVLRKLSPHYVLKQVSLLLVMVIIYFNLK